MELKLEGMLQVGKKMVTESHGNDGADVTTCQIKLGKLRVQREQLDELAGWPIGVSATMFNEVGIPYQPSKHNFPKRVLLVTGILEVRRDSGKTVAKLELTGAANAVAAGIAFILDAPDDQGPTAVMAFHLMWKARGDEVEDMEALLGCNKVFANLVFKEPPQQQPLFNDSKVSPAAEAAAGARAKVDRKKAAANDKEDVEDGPVEAGDGDAGDPLIEQAKLYISAAGYGNVVTTSGLQRVLNIGYNRASALLETFENLGLVSVPGKDGKRTSFINTEEGDSKVVDLSIARLTKEATELAKQKPRRDPPPPKGKR